MKEECINVEIALELQVVVPEGADEEAIRAEIVKELNSGLAKRWFQIHVQREIVRTPV